MVIGAEGIETYLIMGANYGGAHPSASADISFVDSEWAPIYTGLTETVFQSHGTSLVARL